MLGNGSGQKLGARDIWRQESEHRNWVRNTEVSWKKKRTENGEKYVNIVVNIRINEAYRLLKRSSLTL
jgi:hypothetical protein